MIKHQWMLQLPHHLISKLLQTPYRARLNILITNTDSEGETALHLAVRYNRKNVVQLLIQKDPDHIYPQNIRLTEEELKIY